MVDELHDQDVADPRRRRDRLLPKVEARDVAGVGVRLCDGVRLDFGRGQARLSSRPGPERHCGCRLIIYWSDEDEAYVAEAPELPGCAADGETYAQALANAEVVIREWIETARELGRPIPEAKGRLLYA